jgi:tRNA threonylcarbamoyladenosine biosynthesis protein TsaE
MDAIFGKAQINTVAATFWQQYHQHKIWAFFAPMGSGKTTFIHALCKHVLQVTDNVASPTFSLINQYESTVAGTIYHMDWYRLNSTEEAIQAGIEEVLYSNHLCLIEWPEKAPELLPKNALAIHIEILDEYTRRIFITPNITEEL